MLSIGEQQHYTTVELPDWGIDRLDELQALLEGRDALDQSKENRSE